MSSAKIIRYLMWASEIVLAIAVVYAIAMHKPAPGTGGHSPAPSAAASGR